MGSLDHAIWWHVYPLGATGAPIRDRDESGITPRLRRLDAWLDYAVELGVSGLLLGPVFASRSHGYDTVDYFRVDPRLGTEADLDDLIAGCHQRGLQVLLDGVFNHVSTSHPLFTEALAQGPDSDAGRMFVWHVGAGGEPAYGDFEGHHDLAALNHDNPAVADLVVDVMTHWLDHGVDGWRLDAAYAVAPQRWAPILTRVRERFPEAVVVGEVLRGDFAEVVATSGMDSVTQYELWKAIWSSLLDRNFFELSWALERHGALVEQFVPQTFIGNHDVTRLASRVGDADAVLALVVLCTVGGAPSIYYGDEQGFRGVKEERFGGDDAIRPELPAGPEDLPASGWATYRTHQELLGMRRRHPWLVRARTRVVSLTNEHLTYVATGPGRGEALTVELDLTRGARASVRHGTTVEFAFEARKTTVA
jgi:glycosidase